MEQLKKELNECTIKNTEYFSFAGKRFLCKCLKVYDGDTITVVFKPFKESGDDSIYKYTIRLSGIDTYELRTDDPDKKNKAIEARDLLREKILNKFIYIECGEFDKYGRLLGYIYDENNMNINELLIDSGLAIRY